MVASAILRNLMQKALSHDEQGRFESPYEEPRAKKVIGVRLPVSLFEKVMELSGGKAAEFLIEAAREKIEGQTNHLTQRRGAHR